MRNLDWSHSALLARFAAFYEELAQCKEAIQKGGLPRLFEGQMPAEPSPDDLANLVSRRLLRRLDYQLREVSAQGTSEDRENYRRALYVMAALADEIFLIELVWAGNQPWLGHLLEQSLFHSRHAGQQFFLQIEELLRTQGNAQKELAAIFLLALQLGFKGEYRGHGGHEMLDGVRQRLIAFIGADRAESDRGWKAPFAQAYGYTLFEHADQRLAPLKPWLRLAAITLVAYLLASCALWFSFLLPAAANLQRLIAQGG